MARYLQFTNKKNASINERATNTLSTLQQNARAMNILRSSLESRMNFTISNKGNTEDYEELAWILDLVKKGEMVLNTISDRKESDHYLEELITIINNTALSMGEVRNGIDDAIVVAWPLLSQLLDAISKVSTGALPDSRDEMEPSLLAELSMILALGKAHTPKESTVTWASEKKEDEGLKELDQGEGVMA